MHKSLTILIALLIDLIWGDPPNRFHPVVLMGHWLNKGRYIAPKQHRFWFGAGWVSAGIALFTLPWLLIKKRGTWNVERGVWNTSKPQRSKTLHTTYCTPRPTFHVPRTLATALALKPVFAYLGLRQSVLAVGQALEKNNLTEAQRLTAWHLVSRDTSRLNSEEIAGAAIESLAENITDSVTAPLLAYSLGGLPLAWGYRFINTADAMWGYRTAEFEQLGKFVARLDDMLNWLPARLTGWLMIMATWLAGQNSLQAKKTMLSHHQQTSSPNAGWTMSAMAGALGVTLNKHNMYNLVGGEGRLNNSTIRQAIRIADMCVGLTIFLLISLTLIWEKIK